MESGGLQGISSSLVRWRGTSCSLEPWLPWWKQTTADPPFNKRPYPLPVLGGVRALQAMIPPLAGHGGEGGRVPVVGGCLLELLPAGRGGEEDWSFDPVTPPSSCCSAWALSGASLEWWLDLAWFASTRACHHGGGVVMVVWCHRWFAAAPSEAAFEDVHQQRLVLDGGLRPASVFFWPKGGHGFLPPSRRSSRIIAPVLDASSTPSGSSPGSSRRQVAMVQRWYGDPSEQFLLRPRRFCCLEVAGVRQRRTRRAWLLFIFLP